MRNAVCENLQCHFYFYICRKIQIEAMGILFIKILRIFVVLAVLFSGTMGYVISEKTLAAWWIPVGVALAAGMLSLPRYRKWIWLTTVENRIVNVLCHLVCVGSFCYVLFLSGNNLLADADEYEVTVTVLDKRMEQHEKRRKVGKHRYVSDGMRYEYYLEVAFDNGTVKTLHVSRAVYRNAQKRQPKALSLSQGGFGLPVIKQGI